MRKDIPPRQPRSRDVLHGKTEEEIRKFFMEEFGISLEGYWISVGRKRAYFSTSKPFSKGVTGIPLCRISAGIKPTSYAMQILGKKASKRVVKLGKEEAMKFIEGYDIPNDCERGYVLVFLGEDCLGVGYCRGGMIENLLPKAMRRKLLDSNDV